MWVHSVAVSGEPHLFFSAILPPYRKAWSDVELISLENFMSSVVWKFAAPLLGLPVLLSAAALSTGCKRPAEAHVITPDDRTMDAKASSGVTAAPAATAPAGSPALIDYADKGAHL